MAPRQRQVTPQSSSEDETPLQQPKPVLLDKDELVADIERERHDFFNIIALLFVVASTLIDWKVQTLPLGLSVAYKGDYFWMNWATTLLYFFVDLIWVSIVPVCVKSPGTIVKHHIVAIAYLSAPVIFPEFRWFMGACLSVEINTWFLILRRVIYKRQESLPAVLVELVSLCFYISWIIIRCIIYPAILVVFLQLAVKEVEITNKFWHWPMLFIPVHLILCLLNLKWSYDLFTPIIAKWLKQDKAQISVSSGL